MNLKSISILIIVVVTITAYAIKKSSDQTPWTSPEQEIYESRAAAWHSEPATSLQKVEGSTLKSDADQKRLPVPAAALESNNSYENGNYTQKKLIGTRGFCQEGSAVARKLILKAQFGIPQVDELMHEYDVDMSRAVILDESTITLDERDPYTGNIKCSVNWKIDIEKWQDEFSKPSLNDNGNPKTSLQEVDIFNGNNVGFNQDPFVITLKFINASNPRASYQVKPMEDGRIWVTIIAISNR